MNKKLYFLIFTLLVLCSCTSKEPDPEIGATEMLNTARRLMNEKDYEAAKDSVLLMRQKFPKALKTRTRGIVVMDSIELLQAQDSLAVVDSILQAERSYFNTLQKRDHRVITVNTTNNVQKYSTSNSILMNYAQKSNSISGK